MAPIVTPLRIFGLALLLIAPSAFAQTTSGTTTTTTTTSGGITSGTILPTTPTTATGSSASTAATKPTTSPTSSTSPGTGFTSTSSEPTVKTVTNPSTPTPAGTTEASVSAVSGTPDAGPKLPPRATAGATDATTSPQAESSAATPAPVTAADLAPKTVSPAVTPPPSAPATPLGAAAAAADELISPGLTSAERTLEPPAMAPALVDPLLPDTAGTPAPPVTTAALLDQHISLDLRDIDVADVLKFLAIKANLNLVGSTGVTGTVTLLLNDVSIRDAIDIILSSNRLAYNIKGNIMRVMTEEEYKALYGKEFYDKRETKIVQLKYASPKNVGAMLDHVKSTVGRIVFDDSTGTVVMTDTPEKIKEMEEVIRHEELPSIVRLPPTATEIVDLQYAQAAKVSEKLSPSLTKDLGKIFVDERSNRLIISDLPYKLSEIREVVKALDTKTREVFIEAKIIQVALNDKFQGGIDWASIASKHFQQTFPVTLAAYGQMTLGTITPTTTTDAAGESTTTFGGSGTIMKLLETFGRTSILSSPQIAVVDGEEAKIMVGSKEAYTTSSVTQSQATTTTAQQVTFVDVGVTLHVTPTINTNGFITMKIKPEVSSVTRFLTTSQGDQIPIVESTNAETRVMVRDGSTVLIGGLKGSRRTKARVGLPVISRIPVLGALFRSTDDRGEKTELSILLTPHIMSGEETFPGTHPSAIAQINIPFEQDLPPPEATGSAALPDATISAARSDAPSADEKGHKQK